MDREGPRRLVGGLLCVLGECGVEGDLLRLRWQRYPSTHRYSESPPHQSPSAPASPRGEAYVLRYVGMIATVFFYISHTGLANRLPLGVQLSGGQLEIKSILP